MMRSIVSIEDVKATSVWTEVAEHGQDEHRKSSSREEKIRMHFRQRHLILIGLSFLLVALVVGGVELIRYLTLLQQSAQKVRVTPITTPTNPNQLDMSHA